MNKINSDKIRQLLKRLRMSKGQKYTDEFKELIIQIILDNKKSIVQLSKELGLSDRTLYKWTYAERVYRKVVKDQDYKNLTDEINKLKKDLRQTKKERDILKIIISKQII